MGAERVLGHGPLSAQHRDRRIWSPKALESHSSSEQELAQWLEMMVVGLELVMEVPVDWQLALAQEEGVAAEMKSVIQIILKIFISPKLMRAVEAPADEANSTMDQPQLVLAQELPALRWNQPELEVARVVERMEPLARR